MNFLERTQVLSSLAGVPKWETRPETGSSCKRCPCWKKGRRGEQGSGVSSEGLTPSLGVWELARGEGKLGVACLLQGWFVSVSLKGATGQAAALPPVLSFWPAEFYSLGQPVPKGGSVPPGTSSGGKQRTSRPYQTCCKLTSGAQDSLTFQIAPPDVVGERTTRVYNHQNTASVFCPQDVRRNCMIGTAALLVSLPLAILLCCVVIRRRRKRRQ